LSNSARCRPSSTKKRCDLCSSGKTSSRNGQARHSLEERVIGPRTSSAVSLTMLGRCRPRPSTGLARAQPQQQCCFERCRSHPPPKGDVSRASSRASWKTPLSDKPRAPPPGGEETPRSIAQRPPDACGRPRSTPSAHGMGRLQPRIASALSNTAATVEPASRRRCTEATIPGTGGATTVRRIEAPHPSRQVRESSAAPYDERRSWPVSKPRLPSPSTRGRQGQSCGLRTTGWHASWEGRTMTTSSSATSPFSSPTLLGPGWSICLLRRSPIGTTWSRLSWEISRVRTCALGTHGISEATASSQGNPCESTSGGF
jgi:hypothetical protein